MTTSATLLAHSAPKEVSTQVLLYTLFAGIMKPPKQTASQPTAAKYPNLTRWINKMVQKHYGRSARRIDASNGVNKHRRYWPSDNTLLAFRIRADQLIMKREPFEALVADIMLDYNSDLCFEYNAVSALQEASEAYLVGLFEDSNLLALNRRDPDRMITAADMQLARRLRGAHL